MKRNLYGINTPIIHNGTREKNGQGMHCFDLGAALVAQSRGSVF